MAIQNNTKLGGPDSVEEPLPGEASGQRDDRSPMSDMRREARTEDGKIAQTNPI